MTMKYRLDGSRYPEGDEGLLEWAMDMQDSRGRIVRQELLWNGIWLSTVWTGLPSALSLMYSPRSVREEPDGEIVIEDVELLGVSTVPHTHGTFETMAFFQLEGFTGFELGRWQWDSIEQAEGGHFWVKSFMVTIRYTLWQFWQFLRAACREQDEL